MARIFITGSTDGIGQAAARLLCDQGHRVTLHARNAQRAEDARAAVPKAEDVLIGDLSSIADIKKLAEQTNGKEPFDTVIHNAGIGYGGTSSQEITADGISAVFSVNTLAPYIMTCEMKRPTSRLLYMSSDSHYGGDGSLKNCTQSHSYGNSKLHNVLLAKAMARRWTDLQVVSMHPGWVKTKMGGMAAPKGTDMPAKALAEWATGKGQYAKLPSGAFFTPSGEDTPHPSADDEETQERLLNICEDVSKVSLRAT